MKKFMFLLMALPAICLCTACSDGDDEASGIAETPTAKGDHFDGTLYYRITSHTDRQAAVCGAAESAVSIEIPAVVAIDGTTYQCTAIDPEAFANHSKLEQVGIPAGVLAIGYRAFSNCLNLRSVRIPKSVLTIGNYTFEGCRNLASVTISDNATIIGDGAFYQCSGLASVAIPAKVTSVGSYAFAGCSGLKTIYSQNTTPPEARTYAFDQATTQNATLHVPSGSRTAYTQAPVWRNFIHVN